MGSKAAAVVGLGSFQLPVLILGWSLKHDPRLAFAHQAGRLSHSTPLSRNYGLW
jgi:hypothetical protein